MKGKIDIYLRRFKRYIKYGIQYYFYEKPKGLDFTMRDMHLTEESKGVLHGYSKTNEKHLAEIFRYLNIQECDSLLDVGCGKGVVLKEAAKQPFCKITGIDIDSGLIETANRNFRILHLSDRIKCVETDALCYPGYGEYNTFFFFNPFGEEVMRAVIDKIIMEHAGKKQVRIIYHNPVYRKAVEDTGKFESVKEMHDTMKDYRTVIYVSNW